MTPTFDNYRISPTNAPGYGLVLARCKETGCTVHMTYRTASGESQEELFARAAKAFSMRSVDDCRYVDG